MSFTPYLISFLMVLSSAGLLATPSSTDSLSFPASWVGKWEGTLVIYNAQGVSQRVGMQLHILPLADHSYTWTIVYGDTETSTARNYLLKPANQDTGHYQIDEQNTILLDAYLLGEKLVSTFEVNGTYLIASYERKGQEIHYEIVAGPTTEMHSSGNTGTGEAKVPEVKSYPVRTRQVAVLQRV